MVAYDGDFCDSQYRLVKVAAKDGYGEQRCHQGLLADGPSLARRAPHSGEDGHSFFKFMSFNSLMAGTGQIEVLGNRQIFRSKQRVHQLRIKRKYMKYVAVYRVVVEVTFEDNLRLL